jgi:tRNA(adenine34) deaminase
MSRWPHETGACGCTRRVFLASGVAALLPVKAAHSQAADRRAFIAAAAEMRDAAVRAGDQSYGAVLVLGGEIVGYGPSRVVTRGDATAHAEREAIRDAQRRLGRSDLAGSELFSTSRPCAACEQAAAQARVARMYFGPNGSDAGAPRAD